MTSEEKIEVLKIFNDVANCDNYLIKESYKLFAQKFGLTKLEIVTAQSFMDGYNQLEPSDIVEILKHNPVQ